MTNIFKIYYAKHDPTSLLIVNRQTNKSVYVTIDYLKTNPIRSKHFIKRLNNFSNKLDVLGYLKNKKELQNIPDYFPELFL